MSKTSLRFACLFCLLFICTGFAACNSSPSVRKVPPAPSQEAVQTWIKQHAFILKTTDPQATLDDLLSLKPLIGVSSLVGLGEETHGSHEFFTMKHRLLEFLVARMGFTMFAMEGNWSAGEQINRYVMQGQGDAAEVLQLFHFWTWNTQEVLDLLKWMRAYNANSTHIRKISFAAFDCQYIGSSTYDSVVHYLQSVDPKRVATVVTLYRGLRPDPAGSATKHQEAYQQLSLSTRQHYLTQAKQVYDLLTLQKATYEGRSSPQAFALILQDARVIVQQAQIWSVTPNEGNRLRDEAMAENIAWLHEHTENGRKLVLWAHNIHIATDDPIAMGTHLRKRYGSGYLAIGMSFYEGSFNAYGLASDARVTSVQPFTVQLSSPGSYNDVLGHVDLSLYALDLRHIPDGPAYEWLKGPHDFATIGPVYSTNTASISIMNPWALLQSFDILIHIQRVGASQLLPLAP